MKFWEIRDNLRVPYGLPALLTAGGSSGQKEEAIQCIFKSASDSDFKGRGDLQCIRRNVVQRHPGGRRKWRGRHRTERSSVDVGTGPIMRVWQWRSQ
jgi:hypothetical protein